MSDDVGRLRTRLWSGEWRALLEPGAEGLPRLALRMDAGWWLRPTSGPDSSDGGHRSWVNRISGDLDHAMNDKIRAAREAWKNQPMFSVEEARAAEALTAAYLDTATVDVSDHHRALAILSRWP